MTVFWKEGASVSTTAVPALPLITLRWAGVVPPTVLLRAPTSITTPFNRVRDGVAAADIRADVIADDAVPLGAVVGDVDADVVAAEDVALAGRQPADRGEGGVVADADAEVIEPAGGRPAAFVPTKLPTITVVNTSRRKMPTALPLTTLPCPEGPLPTV